MGIDGYSFMEHLPVQVKQSRVGRNVVDNFETAVERSGKHKGYIVGLGFTKGAKEEAARAKAAKGIEIELVEVSILVKGAPDQSTPDLLEIFNRLPATPQEIPLVGPKKDARPSAEELSESDLAAGR